MIETDPTSGNLTGQREEDGMATATKDKDDTVDQIVSLRDEENLDWKEIADRVGIGQGKAAYLYLTATVKKVKFKDEDELVSKITELRNGGNSWGKISAMLSVPEGRCKRLFSEATGEKHHRIGKGGRWPKDYDGETNGHVAEKPKAKRGKAKAAAEEPEDEAPAKRGKSKSDKGITDMTLRELQARLDGKTVTVASSKPDGKPTRIKVKSINKLKNGEVDLTDQGGKSRTVAVTQILKATK